MRQAHIKNVVKTEIPVIDKKVLDSHPAFKNMSLKSPIPKNSRFRVQFDLLGGSAALANAIRLTVCEELQWKAFELDPKDIVTTEKNILVNELCDRIMLLPLNQNVNEDAIFKIEVVADAHTKTSKTSTIVRSSAIEQSGGKKFSEPVCDWSFRIALLNAGTRLVVNNIRVVTGKGYDNSKFSNGAFTYENMDYVDIRSLESYHLEVYEKVSITELAKHLKIKDTSDPGKLYDAVSAKRIIMISDPTAISRASKEVVDRVNGFDHIIENRIEPASSLTEDPKNFRLGFEFYNVQGVQGAVEVVQRAIADITERLEYLSEHISKRSDPDRITISENEDKCTITVRGEDDAIANLIVTYVVMRVPDIPLINYRKVHPNLRSFKLRIMHPQYMKVLTDTIAELVAMMKKLKL